MSMAARLSVRSIALAIVICDLLGVSPCAAYESDVHYTATYVLARAAGWSEGDSRVIASANQGMDENFTTHAALEFNLEPAPLRPGDLHQANKNFTFHCFSGQKPEVETIGNDVNLYRGALLAKINMLRDTERLIALGVALHCVQDSFSHHDYGGSCFAYKGNCTGHTFDSILDTPLYRLNPDNPGVKWGLREALSSTFTYLLSFSTDQGSRVGLSSADIEALISTLSKDIKEPDDQRRQCNQHRAGAWLRDVLTKRGRPITETTISAEPDCGSIGTLAIPSGKFPQFDGSASPTMNSGDYAQVGSGQFDVQLMEFEVVQTPISDGLAAYTVKVRGVGFSQVAAAAAIRILLVPDVGSPNPKGIGIDLPVSSSEENVVKTVSFTARELTDFVAEAVLQPGKNAHWVDRNIHNNRLGCAFDRREGQSPQGFLMNGLEGRVSGRSCKSSQSSVKNVVPNVVPNAPAGVHAE